MKTFRFFAVCLALNALATISMGQTASPQGMPNPIAISKKAISIEVDSISKRLLAVMESVPAKVAWPPVFEIIDSDKPNANAAIKNNQPTIFLNTGIIKVTEGLPDRLAYVIAHELIHILNGHCTNSSFAGNGVVENSFSRLDEEKADVEGFELLVRAGFSPKEAVNTFTMFRDNYGDISPLEAQAVDHPSWTERLANIDKNRQKLWRSMSAFNTGITLLMGQNYDAAVSCFDQVFKIFPTCFEAVSNMGYARLMQAFDLLNEQDIIEYNIGQIVPGGFYKKSAVLENLTRSSPNDYGKYLAQAISLLESALRINSDLSLVKSYLGIAYFLDPYRTQTSVGLSERYLTEAIRSVENDTTLDSALKACIYLNTGAIELARNNYVDAEKSISEGRASLKNHKNDPSSKNFSGSISVNFRYFSRSINGALDYNQVLTNFRKTNGILTNEDLEIIQRYLQRTDPTSNWWNPAYRIYETGSINLKKQPLTKEQILLTCLPVSKPIKSIVLDDFAIYLSQNMTEIIAKLPNYKKVPEVESHKIYRYQFPDEGIEILAGDKVLTIDIKAPNSRIKLGSITSPIKEIGIGVPWKTIRTIFKDRYPVEKKLPNSSVKYYCYSDLGIGFALKNSIVSELIIF
jgi:tetratricopeptide (TPR) repeat protein